MPAMDRNELAGTLNCKLTIRAAVQPARTQLVAPMLAMPQLFILREGAYGRSRSL